MIAWTGALLGLSVHLVLLYAVFDVYYSSPLVHGMRSYGANAAPPADRLVLFVADGLRAQSFFECNSDGSVKSPFLRRMSRKGTWGTSITRVPTESRPGYVAIISGFPEDIGAVMYGWRENPVAFDSFFNQSRYTWSWGSSEIVSMFSKAESQDHVFTQSYPTHMQEFYREAYRLDDWVFRKFEAFLNSTLTNDTLHDMVHQNKVVFFLNLLAMDVIGHSSKPHSEMYREGIRMLDSGIEEVYRLVEGYFADQRTVYVFTADHGMTDWGSHGAGSPQETLTPVVIWGSGINQLPDAVSSACWPSSPVDINQVDIAPLMSALIGAAFPANSIGVVPLEYLNVSSRSKALVMLANFRQLLEQLLIQKRRKRQMYWSIFFREFPGMTMQRVRTLTDALEYLLSKQRYVTIVDICKQWIPTVLQGMQYYHQYERRLLTCCIVASFCAWLLCMFSFLVVSKRLDLTLSHCNYFDMGLMGGLLFLLWCNSFRATFMLYAMMPFYLFHAANLRWIDLKSAVSWRPTLLAPILLGIIFLEMLMLTFFYRCALMVCIALMALWVCSLSYCPLRLRLSFATLCVANSLFTVLPVVGQQPRYDLVLSFCFGCNILMLLLVSWRNYFLPLFLMQVVVTLAMTYVPAAVRRQESIPAWVRFLCWSLLFLSFVFPSLVSTFIIDKLVVTAFCFLLPFTLMSVSYEPLFLVTYTVHVYTWIAIELKLPPSWICRLNFREEGVLGSKDTAVRVDDVRRAFFFISFLFLGFFGTGNIASVNSFDPNFIILFVQVYRPFVMCALLIVKMIIPFMIACCSLCALSMFTNSKMETLYWLVVIVGDMQAVQFLLLLKDTGSWLEIGESISHYLIAMTMTAVVMLLSYGARFYTKCQIFAPKKHLP